MTKIKYIKILTSVFIILLFILLCSPSSYALTGLSTIQTYYNNNSTLQSESANYDNVFYVAVQYNGSTQYSGYFVFTDDTDLNFTGTFNNSGYWSNVQLNISSGSKVYYRHRSTYSNPDVELVSNDVTFQLNGFDIYPYSETAWTDKVYAFKGAYTSLKINDTYIVQPTIPYDLSFVIVDEDTNTEHNFDFNFIEGEFADGRSFEADDLVLGHYVVSISSLVHNTYELLDSTEDTWWICGYIDYVDYDDTTDSKTQFYWSSGYETLKILNEKSTPLTCYRFSFKGYSSDSFNFENLVDSTNIINVSNSKSYYLSDKYSCPVGSTFAYSNRNIYWGVDTSLYGFNGLTDKIFFEEGNDIVTLGVHGIKVNEIMSDSDYIDSQVSSFGTNNDSSSYPSSSIVLSSDGLHTYSGTNIDEIQPYSSVINYSGNSNQQAVDDLTEDWTINDYVAQLPKTISNIPTAISDNIKASFIPKESELVTNIEDFNNWADNHFGSFYNAVSYVWNLIKTIDSKYTSTYSQYPFTIPGIRWFNPITGQKEILVQQQTIDLGAICMNDDDWLFFWSTTRYLTSFLIYITLIVMLYNKFRNLLGYDSIFFSGANSALGSINSMKDNINDSYSDLRYNRSPLKRLRDSRVDHTWNGPTM